MKLDEIVAILAECGLAQKEARAFAHLTHLGPSKVADLARAAGLSRAETYQLLEHLQGRGLVEGTLTRPRVFSAVPAARAMDVLVAERQGTLRAVETRRGDLTERLTRLSGNAPDPGSESFRILQDRNQIAGQLIRTLRSARESISFVSGARSLFSLLLDEGLEGEFAAAAGRGVRIRVVTEILAGAEETLARLNAFGQVRHLMVPRPLRFVIADEREIVQYVTADPLFAGSKETALWIGARDHVQAQQAFFDDLWGGALPVASRLEELASGRASEQVQVVKGRLTRYEKEKEMILRAREEVVLQLSPGDAARLQASGVARALQLRLKEGIHVRILVPPDARVALPGAQVRLAQPRESLPRVLVDRAEALVVFHGKGSSEDITSLEEYGVWVSLAPSVETLWRGFEKRWSEADPA